jgi:hypothetical protein
MCVFRYGLHLSSLVVLMSSLSNVNQYPYVKRRVSAVVAYWTHMHGVMGANPGRVEAFFFHAAAMLSFYIMQRITAPKFCIF